MLIWLHCVLCYTEWTTDGCVTDLAEVEEGVVTCRCTHLTNFAILVVSIPSVCVCLYADKVHQGNVIHRGTSNSYMYTA